MTSVYIRSHEYFQLTFCRNTANPTRWWENNLNPPRPITLSLIHIGLDTQTRLLIYKTQPRSTTLAQPIRSLPDRGPKNVGAPAYNQGPTRFFKNNSKPSSHTWTTIRFFEISAILGPSNDEFRTCGPISNSALVNLERLIPWCLLRLIGSVSHNNFVIPKEFNDAVECKISLFSVFPEVIANLKHVLCARILIFQHFKTWGWVFSNQERMSERHMNILILI